MLTEQDSVVLSEVVAHKIAVALHVVSMKTSVSQSRVLLFMIES